MKLFSTWRRTLRSFASDRRGNVVIMFGVALVPLLGMAGVAIDYGRAATARSQLNAAADSAALAAVSQSAMQKTVADATLDAQKFFDANAGQYSSLISNRTVNITTAGLGRTVNVTYTASYPTSLMSLLGQNTISLSSTATAVGARAPYIDFHLLLDNTPSMGVAATTADINTMVNNTPDQCGFACHIDNSTNDYYAKARQLGVTLRIDVVRSASQQLMDTAKSTAKVANQYRMAVYTMGSNCNNTQLTTIQSLTADLSAAKTASNAIDLMSIPYQGFNNDQCTNFDQALTDVNKLIATPGDGSTAAAPQKVLYFVSDGVADYANSSSCSQPTTGGRCQQPVNPAFCQTIKDRGIKIAVLYTTYLPLPTNGWYNTWIRPFQSQIPVLMANCASPGLYFEVGPNGGIADAMNALFQKIVLKSYLSG